MADQIENNNSNKRKREDDLLDEENEKNLELEESYITMIDVLKEEEKLEEDAYAVLGGSDDKNCTYDDGPIYRQAIYSCKTCMGDNPNENDIFGICLACCLECHKNHELFELYTKRLFRCDCSTTKLKQKCCTFNSLPTQNRLNEDNKYNHNFIGKYCICEQPYPNPEGEDREMVQCIICEDWYHDDCLESSFPDNEDYAEMICKNCMQNNQFLSYYHTEKIKKVKNEENKNANVDLVNLDDKNADDKKEKIKDNQIKEEVKLNGNDEISDKTSIDDVTSTEELKEEKKIDNENNQEEFNGDAVINKCKLNLLKSKLAVEDVKSATTFWPEGWRLELCKCKECLNMYAKSKLDFLIDENDTVHFYEAKGKEKSQRISQYERGLNEISKMDHVAGIDAIMGKTKNLILIIN